MGKMHLTDTEREQLLSAARRRTVRAADVRRAKLILLLGDGESREGILSALGCDWRFIARWSGRFLSERLAGLYAGHPGRAPVQPPAELEARVPNRTLKHEPADGSTHWSSYTLAAELGNASVWAVQRIWRKHGVKPQRLERRMVSNDPALETKAADVIGLYLNPPAHSAVFCVDEKTAIQAPERKGPMLPLSPGRAESHGLAYQRNGTLSSFAAFDTAAGEAVGKTAPRHTSDQFVAFLI
ncbi:IS630 family transposase [Xanthomonas theicola]|uniref:IS630 family transposase n=2 Tax=Xanthomonas theicola TaxID=56464 RepID=UPI001C8D9E44|nr:IS630 family transposase [Xanthomonas theicola]